MRKRPWAGLAAKYGAAGENAHWRVIFDHYYWDRVEQAYRAAKTLGAGSVASGLVGFRMIEGEYVTRSRSVTRAATDWLDVEAVESSLPMEWSSLERALISSCDRVAKRIKFEHSPKTLISVLTDETNVPWMPGRHGYCMDKFPYDKICIPASSLRDSADLEHVILHEYAHVITLNLSNGQCPLWLDEAVAMVAGGGVDRRAWSALASGAAPWLQPHDLGAAYLMNREDERERSSVWLAYQQSAAIGFYLSSLKGDQGLGDLMRSYTNNTLLVDLMMRIRGAEPTDEALQEVYGFGIAELFEGSLDWLRTEVL